MDLIGPYTLKGKDGTQIDFMCVTMIDPATSWFEIVELPVSQLSEHDSPMGTQGHKGSLTHKQKKEHYFDKTSATVGSLLTGPGFVVTHVVNTLSTTTQVHLSFTSKPYVTHMG